MAAATMETLPPEQVHTTHMGHRRMATTLQPRRSRGVGDTAQTYSVEYAAGTFGREGSKNGAVLRHWRHRLTLSPLVPPSLKMALRNPASHKCSISDERSIQQMRVPRPTAAAR